MMILRKYKKYTSHKDVKQGDIVRITCETTPKNSQYKMRPGSVQLWVVREIYDKGIAMSKYKAVKPTDMTLHDEKVIDGVLAINQFKFHIEFANKFNTKIFFTDLIITFMNIFKRKNNGNI